MATRFGPAAADDQRIIVGNCLDQLRILSLDLDTYGDACNAQTLREIIEQLEKVGPASPRSGRTSDFVVETFKVQRSEVASMLCRAFENGKNNPWFKVTEFVKPSVFEFKSKAGSIVPHLDYPLNQGGALVITRRESGSATFRLDLGSIASGLNDMAAYYRRHFADFLNARADSITADVFLQCCMFGELVYG